MYPYLKTFIWIFSAALSCHTIFSNEAKSPKDILIAAELVIAKAKVDIVDAAKDSDVIFEAAKVSWSSKSFGRARYFFETGLKLAPWDLEAQLSYDILLKQLDETEKSKQVANIVLQTSEEDHLLKTSCKLLDRSMPPLLKFLPNSLPSPEKKVICLVNIGNAENWILSKAGQRLSQTLGTSVYLYPQTINLPKHHRSLYQRWINDIKKDINWDNYIVRLTMKNMGIKSAQSATPDQVLELLAKLTYKKGESDPRPNILKTKKHLQQRDKQWDVSILLNEFAKQVPANPNIVFIGITAADIYANQNNYLFGTALTGQNKAIISYCRYKSRYYNDRENQRRFLDRIHKQLLSSTGFALGIGRPTDPRSARSYPNGLQDHDQKGTWLSPECILGFEKTLGHELPFATKAEMLKGMQHSGF